MPFSRPTIADLYEQSSTDMEARIPGADARTRRAVLTELAKVLAGGLHGEYGFIDWVSRQRLVSTADAEYLDRHGAVWGIARNAATFSTGVVLFSGENGSVIPLDASLRRADGREYVTTESGTISGGTASVPISAVLEGLDGNADAGAPVAIVSPISGVSSSGTVSGSGLTGGADEESDEDYRERILDRIQEPPHGGSATDYIAWAKEISGVTDVWVFPLESGTATVAIRFMMYDTYDDGIPLQDDVDRVQEHIDAVRPVTAVPVVGAPTATPIPFEIALTPNTAEVKAAVAAELKDLFRREAAPGGVIYLSRIREAVSVAAGETNNTVLSPTADVTQTSTEIATVGTIVWA